MQKTRIDPKMAYIIALVALFGRATYRVSSVHASNSVQFRSYTQSCFWAFFSELFKSNKANCIWSKVDPAPKTKRVPKLDKNSIIAEKLTKFFQNLEKCKKYVPNTQNMCAHIYISPSAKIFANM